MCSWLVWRPGGEYTLVGWWFWLIELLLQGGGHSSVSVYVRASGFVVVAGAQGWSAAAATMPAKYVVLGCVSDVPSALSVDAWRAFWWPATGMHPCGMGLGFLSSPLCFACSVVLGCASAEQYCLFCRSFAVHKRTTVAPAAVCCVVRGVLAPVAP